MGPFVQVVLGQIISLFGNAALRFVLPLILLRQTGSAAVYGTNEVKALRLMLPRPCCITYCIKYARICIYFFEKLYAFLPLFHLKSGLSYHKNPISGIFWC